MKAVELRALVELDLTGEEEAAPDRAGIARVFSWVVVGLMAIESALGFLVDGLYPEEAWAIAAFRGNDLVTLVLVAPALAAALVLGQRSARWRLVWLGALLYSTYNFAYYAFGAAFNDVFLLHVATLTLSIAALVGLVMRLDVEAMAAAVTPRGVHRLVAAYMTLVGCALIAAWGGLSLRFAMTGELPQDVMPPSAVHLVYALDMALLAPAFLTGGLLLWGRRPWGYALGAAVNMFGAAYLVVLEFVGGFQANAGIADTTWNSPPAIVGALACATAAALVLRDVRQR